MKNLFSLVLLFMVYNSLLSQEGAPLLTHYKESREIENQSWAVSQDENNVMLFANRRGIMTFDGRTWSFITMPAIPYSLKYNSNNKRVYVGCSDNYGYLQKDEKGFYKYVSLLPDSVPVGLISGILFTDSTVYFYSDITINRHNIRTGYLENRLVSKEEEPFTGMFITPRNSFVNVMSKGLFRVEADTLFPIVTGYILENEEILFSLPYDDNLVLLGLGSGTLYLFDGIKFNSYHIKDDGYLSKSILSEGISVSDSLYAFATLDGGAIVVSKKSGKLTHVINYSNGLPDDEVFAMGVDNSNGLWLSHQFGLSRADLHLPIRNFSIYPGLKGNLITSVLHNGELYVATSEGVFYLTEERIYSQSEVVQNFEKAHSVPQGNVTYNTLTNQPQTIEKTKKRLLSRIFGKKSTNAENVKEIASTPEKEGISPAVVQEVAKPQVSKRTIKRLESVSYLFKKVSGVNEKCKQLVSTPFGILVATNQGLYNISGHSAKIIVNDQYVNFISKRTNDGKYYIATSDGYFFVTAESDKWTSVFPDKNFTQPLYAIAPVNSDTLWAGGNSKAYKITNISGGKSVNYQTYTLKNDFPKKYFVEYINDTVFLITESGISYYSASSDSYKEYSRVGVKTGSKLDYLYSQPEVTWYNHEDEWISLSGDWRNHGNSKALLKIFDEVISISVSGNFLWVVTGDNQLFRLTISQNLSIKPDIDLFVRSVSNDDGLFFDVSNVVFNRGDKIVYFELVAPAFLKQNSSQYQYIVDKIMDDWSKWSTASTIGLMTPPGKYTLRVRAKDIWGNISEPAIMDFTIKAPFTHTLFFYLIVSALVLCMLVFTIRFRERQLKKEKLILEEKVKERTSEIEAQKQEITSSIEYASRIQLAMLPVEEHFSSLFSDHFVYFRPRDIVSGDFYWIAEDEKHICLAIADCTGHGVPGAFMSSLGISSLSEIVTSKNDLHANVILNNLRDRIKTALHQTGKEGEAADGMDIGFCVIHKNLTTLEFSGAYNPLFIFQGGEFKEYKGDRMPIGIYYGEKETFTNYEININKGDTIYLFTDGFVDQFGGPDCVKYKVSNLKKLLAEIYSKPMAEQLAIIENEFENWRGCTHQIDDITIIGIRM